MWGRATLAMEVSRTSMKAARATVAAISQGLTLGFHRPLLPTSSDIRFPFRQIEGCQIQKREPNQPRSHLIPCEPSPLNALFCEAEHWRSFDIHTVSEIVLYV